MRLGDHRAAFEPGIQRNAVLHDLRVQIDGAESNQIVGRLPFQKKLAHAFAQKEGEFVAEGELAEIHPFRGDGVFQRNFPFVFIGSTKGGMARQQNKHGRN